MVRRAPTPSPLPKPPPKLPCGYFTWHGRYQRALGRAWALSMGTGGFRDAGGGIITKPQRDHWLMSFGRVYPDLSESIKAWQDYSGVELEDAMGAAMKAMREAEWFEAMAKAKRECDPDAKYTPEKPRGDDDPTWAGGYSRTVYMGGGKSL